MGPKRLQVSIHSQRFPVTPDLITSGISALFDILTWHAVFPFPPQTFTAAQEPEPDSPPTPPIIDQDAFFRAVCLLTRNLAPRYAPKISSSPPVHRLISGTWGPHHDDNGWLIAVRGKDGGDFRRRLFRTLAIPVPAYESPDSGEERGNLDAPTMIPIPRFITYQPRAGDDAPNAEPGEEDDTPDQQQVVTMVDEDERSIDLRDILSEYPPETDPLTNNPLRESYGVVTESFSQYWQLHHLTGLSIPRTKLVSLLRLLFLLPVGNGEQPDGGEEATAMDGLITLGERLEEGGAFLIDWVTFDVLLDESSRTEQIGNILSRVFSVFKAPCVE